jgi:hypothetical protein
VAASRRSAFAEAFALGLESADFTPLVAQYAADAQFDALVPGRRVRLEGGAAIVAQLRRWWPEPGTLLRWQVDEFPSGLTIEFEREVEGGRVWRQRQFVHLADGKVSRHQVYAARPQSAAEAPPPSTLGPRLLAELGEVVSVEPLVHAGQAGAWIERATMADGRRFVVKRLLPDRDLLGRLAGLTQSIEVRLWETGAFERLPPEIDTAIVAAAQGDGEAVLVMRDVSEALVGVSRPLSREESRRFLGALAQIHRSFAGAQYDFLCPAETYLRLLAPDAIAPGASDLDYIPKIMLVGWELFAETAPAAVVEAVSALHADATPLASALGEGFGHGDFRCANLGLERARVVVIDWGISTRAPGVLDLAWYLFVNGWRVDAPKEALIADYRASAGDLFDDRTIRLGLLAGLAWFGGLLSHELIESDATKQERARRELDWWCDRANDALALLS